MYAALPAFVSSIFLCYGLYVVWTGTATRVSRPFTLLSFATFAWQCAWVMLFTSSSTREAEIISKVGYAFILFLPTTVYDLVVGVTDRKNESPLVWTSYATSFGLVVLLSATNAIVAGTYTYFFGRYPKAGSLHFCHLVQTAAISIRVAFVLITARRAARDDYRRSGFDRCLLAVGCFSVAMIDYADNYGYDFYPPGVVFVAIALCALASGLTRLGYAERPSLDVSTPDSPTLTPDQVTDQITELSVNWLDLLRAYRQAVDHGLCDEKISHRQIARASAEIATIACPAGGAAPFVIAAINAFSPKGADELTGKS